MKYLLIPLALVAGSAFACPGAESSKDAQAAPASTNVAAAKKANTKQQVATVKADKKATTKTAAATSAKVAGL